MSHVYIIHENSAWTAPLIGQLASRGIPYHEWFLDRGFFDLTSEPPAGVFYNRMSASSHTRDHRFGAELTTTALLWLERHGRRVMNDSRAMSLEINKVAQYHALAAHGIRSPATAAAVGREEIVEAAKSLGVDAFITKHNRGGKGLGVRLFRSLSALEDYVAGPELEEPIDGTTLVQEYIESPDQTITRIEFIGGRFLYAVRVDTSEGFELCPADVCQPGDAFCPATESERPKFRVVEGFSHPLIAPLERFLAENGMSVAAVEIVEDADGVAYAYDVNINTNYNEQAEREAGVSGMGTLAQWLGDELQRQTRNVTFEACAIS